MVDTRNRLKPSKTHPMRSRLGNKVDCRVYTKDQNGAEVDLINIEIIRYHNAEKLQDDHRKILKLAKVIADHFFVSAYLKRRTKRNVMGIGIQIAGIEGQIKKIQLVDKGCMLQQNWALCVFHRHVWNKKGSTRINKSNQWVKMGEA